MQTTNAWDGDHLPPVRTMDWTGFWTIHCEGQMGSPVMVIGKGVGEEMPLVQDQPMIQTLPAEAPNEALDIGVLPRTSGGNHDLFDYVLRVPTIGPQRNPSMRSGVEACGDVQQCACERGYRRAADEASCCTRAAGVVV